MSSYDPPNPIPTPNNFNYAFFTDLQGNLTLESADKRYLKRSGGSIGFIDVLTNINVFGDYYKNSLLVNLDSITGITNGVAQANKALILDSSRNINNINILTAQNIDIDNTNTNPFSLTGNSDLYGLHLHSNFIGTGQNYGCAISFNHSNSNQIPLSAIVLDKKATATGDLVFYTRNGSATLQESMRLKSNGNLGVGVTNPLYQLDLGGIGTGINTGSLKFNDVTFNQNLYLNITSGNVEANKALVPNSDLDLGTFRNITMNGTLTSNIINGQTYRLNNVDANISTLTNLTLGVTAPSKALTLNSFGNILFDDGAGSGNSRNGTNAIQWYGGTAFKERILMYRPNDDSGLVIASNPSTIQKCSPLLWLYSGFDATGVTGTSSAEYKEVIRSEHKLVGLSDNYRSGWFHGYLLGTPAWKSSGFGYGTQFYTSIEALNIAWNSSTTSSFTSGNNLLLFDNQMTLGTTTPQSNYQLTLWSTTAKKGIYLNSEPGAGIYMRGRFGGSTVGRLSIDIEDNAGNVYEYGIRGTTDNPTGWYWFVAGAYRMVLTRATNSRLGVNIQSPSAGLDIRNTNTVGRFSDNTCFFDIWMNTAGLFGRRCFIGTSSNDSLTIQTNDTPRMTILNDGWIGIGTETPRYPLEVANTRNGQEGAMNYYYYLGPGQSNGSTTTTPSNISIRSLGRLLVNSEIDVISDFRKKENIELLNLEYCQRFVEIINPKIFNYKNDSNGRHFGYIAQDLIKNQFAELIMVEIDNTSEEYIDEDGFVSEANRTYTLSRSQIIAILHNVIKSNVNKIKHLENKLDDYIENVDTITVHQRLLNKINQLEESRNELQIINNNLESKLIQQEQININLQSRLEAIENRINNLENNNS